MINVTCLEEFCSKIAKILPQRYVHTLDFLRFLSSENRTFLDQNRHVYFFNAIFENLLVQQRDILVPRGRLVLQKILLREEKCHLYCPFSSSNFVQFLRQFSTP